MQTGVDTALIIRGIRQLIGIGAFELGQCAVLHQKRRQRIGQCQLLEHFFVGTRCTLGCFFQNRQLQLFKQNLLQLLGGSQIKFLAGHGVGFRFDLGQSHAQLLGLAMQGFGVNQGADFLKPCKDLDQGHFKR